MSVLRLLALSATLVGCTPPPKHIGLEGQPQPLRGEDAPAVDALSVSLEQGSLRHRHEMRGSEGCGMGCALRTRSASMVTLELGENGVVTVHDEGALVERFRSVAGHTKHLTEWRRMWKGSWTEGAGVLRMELKPESLDCKRTTGDNQVDEPCQPQRLRLVCEELTLRLDEPKNRKARAWQCGGARKPAVGMTPGPWLFGIDKELRTLDRVRDHRIQRFYAQHGLPEEGEKQAAK